AAYLTGIRANLYGNTDAYWIEGSELAVYSSELQGWETQGDVIELSGKSTPCAWDQNTASCSRGPCSAGGLGGRPSTPASPGGRARRAPRAASPAGQPVRRPGPRRPRHRAGPAGRRGPP